MSERSTILWELIFDWLNKRERYAASLGNSTFDEEVVKMLAEEAVTSKERITDYVEKL